jgi:hypothetical protein
MNKFRKLGYIEYNGKLEIHNSLLNVVLYDKRESGMKDASDERALLCAPFPGCHYGCVIAAAIAFDTETTSMDGESTKSARNAANGGARSETTTTGIGAIATSGRSKGRASRSVQLMP